MQGGERMIPPGVLFRIQRMARQIDSLMGKLHYINYYDASAVQLSDADSLLAEALEVLPDLEVQIEETRLIVQERLTALGPAAPERRPDGE